MTDKQCEKCGGARLVGVNSYGGKICMCTMPKWQVPPLNTITITVDAEIETIKQMISECQHAQMVGSEWYTKGASGLYQHIAEWLRKGRTAINAIDKARSKS